MVLESSPGHTVTCRDISLQPEQRAELGTPGPLRGGQGGPRWQGGCWGHLYSKAHWGQSQTQREGDHEIFHLNLPVACKRPADFRDTRVKGGGCLGLGWWPGTQWDKAGAGRGGQAALHACLHRAAEQP